jgi:xylulokinase
MGLFLAFDLGTTALKTALVRDDGAVLAVHTDEYTLESPRPGWAEMGPEVYWRAVREGTRAVLARSGAAADDLAAIGFSSQGQTFVPIDRRGQPLHNAIVWVDTRAQPIAEAWEREWLSRDYFRAATGYPWVAAGLTVFQIAWLAQNAPQAHAAHKFLFLPDYIIYRLTGQFATDRVIAHFGGFYDLRTRTWNARLLEAAGIDDEQLPVILEPGSVAGQVHRQAAEELGIPAGTPVCVGANDQLAGAVGVGNVRPGVISEATGTALALLATTDELLADERLCVGHHALPDAEYALAFAITSAIVLTWLRDLCGAGDDYEAFLRGVEAIPPGSDGLTVLPHFGGTGTPTYNPEARGALVGLTLGHTRTHLARATMEACACLLQECLEPIIDSGVAVESVRSMGGAARSDAWLQMKADLLGLPVERPACSDAACLGAAMLAATGIGRFDSVREAADAWYRPDVVFAPDLARYAAYRQVYQRYREVYRRLYDR